MSRGRIAISVRRMEAWPCSGCGAEFDLADVNPFAVVTCPVCSTDLHVPAKLGNFVLLNMIGMGGMGAVYKALDPTLNRQVAVKVLLKSVGEDSECVETIRREARAAAQLSHPHVATVYQIGEAHGQPYIVMELVSGKRLDEMMDSGPLDQALVTQTAIEVAEGLTAAARIGLIHNDIKPENILFDEEGNAKLVDFGLAAYADQVAKGGIWGTPFYVSPEKVKGEACDVRSDIYSFGATLYHALTGKPPFNAPSAQDVAKARFTTTPKPMAKLRPDIHPDLARIVMRMMEFEHGKRYPTYASLLGDLKKVVGKLPKADRRALRRVPVLKTKKATTTSLIYAKQEGRTSSRIVVGKRPSSKLAKVSGSYPANKSVQGKKQAAVAKKSGGKRLLAIAATIVFVAGIGWGAFAFSAHKSDQAELDALRRQAAAGLEGVAELREQVADVASAAADNCRTTERGLTGLRIAGIKDKRLKTVASCIDDGKSAISEAERIVADCQIGENGLSWSLGQNATPDSLRGVLKKSAAMESSLRACEEELQALSSRLGNAHGVVSALQKRQG